MDGILAFSGVRITFAAYKLVVVGHLTVLYVKAMQKSLTIEPVVERSVAALKSSRTIPNHGPGQPGWEVTFHLGADWLWLFFSRLEQAGVVLYSGHNFKGTPTL